MCTAENWQYIETVHGKDIGEDLAGSTGGRMGGSRRRIVGTRGVGVTVTMTIKLV